MDRFQLYACSLGIALLVAMGSYSYWLSRQTLETQHSISGIVEALVKNEVGRGNNTAYELEIWLRNTSTVFRIPVRYEPAIPEVLSSVQPGDSIKMFYPKYSAPSVRKSVEIIHLIWKRKALLDFQKVQAASRRWANMCAIIVSVCSSLLLIAHRKRHLRRWWRRTADSRRFFA